MIIKLSASVHSTDKDSPPIVSGDLLTYRNKVYDLSPLPEGGEIVLGDPFVGPVKKLEGQVVCELVYLYTTDRAEPVQSTNPEDYTFTIIEGNCPDPLVYRPAPELVEIIEIPIPNEEVPITPEEHYEIFEENIKHDEVG